MPTPRKLARGCRDILQPRTSRLRRRLKRLFEYHATLHNCHEIETPILEPASLYATLGATSDINVAETYHVSDTTPPLVLRPEGTAGVARALHEDTHTPLRLRGSSGGSPRRVWYAGAMFRRERPQHGRLRQFTQLGLEFMRSSSRHADELTGNDATTNGRSALSDAIADAEVLQLAHDFLTAANMPHVLRLNTLGTPPQRAAFNTALHAYLLPRRHALSVTSRARLASGNCMRILDSASEADVTALENAPHLREFIDAAEWQRLNTVCRLLEDAGVAYRVDERLVRGLDYYTRTAFEFDSTGRDGRVQTVCAGGRYANVFANVCGVGFAIGLERLENAVLDAAATGGCSSEAGGSDDGEETSVVFVLALVDGDGAGEGEDGKVLRAARSMTCSLRGREVVAVSVVESGRRVAKAVSQAVRNGARAVVAVSAHDLRRGVARVKMVHDDVSHTEEAVGVEVGDVGRYIKDKLEKLDAEDITTSFGTD